MTKIFFYFSCYLIRFFFNRQLTKQNIARKLSLTEFQWESMEEMCNLLKPLQVSTTVLCSETTCTLPALHSIISSIINKHMVVSIEDGENVQSFKKEMSLSLKRRFKIEEDDVTAIQLAAFLDPRYKNLSTECETVVRSVHQSIKHQLQHTTTNEIDLQPTKSTALDFLYQSTSSTPDCIKQFELYLSEPQIGHNLDSLV